jgi:hypothetical protein
MKRNISQAILLFFTLALFVVVARAQSGSSNKKSPYPNELPGLALYRESKWKSIEPYVSTRADVERVLGEPMPVYSESMRAWTMGYEYDHDCPDWRIIIVYIGEGGSLPDSLVGHVLNIRLEPKRRVSLKDTVFPEVFLKGYSKDRVNKKEFFTYDDSDGLHYSVSAKDSADKRIHKGDLEVIIYGASEETEAKYRPR